MEKIYDVDIADAIRYLQRLRKTERTGTIFLLTSQRVISQIILARGEIVNARYLRKRGIEAVKRIFERTHFSELSFMEKSQAATRAQRDAQLPAQESIMRLIYTVSKTDNVAAPSVVPVALGSLVDTVSAELSLYIGPMAPIICARYSGSAKNQHDLLRSIDDIAGHIENKADRAEFKRSVTAKLQTV